MAEKGGIGFGEILLIGVGGYLIYNWWASSQTAAPAPVTTTAPTVPTAPVVVATPPATTPPSSTPPATGGATPPTSIPPPTHPPSPNPNASIVGPVTTNVNNSLSANVNVNGTITNISIIFPALSAWDTTGKNVTASLTAQGVNVPALANQMLAAYQAENPGSTFVSGLSGFLPFIWGRGMGQMMRGRRRIVSVPRRGQNYVRAGAPMRRIG